MFTHIIGNRQTMRRRTAGVGRGVVLGVLSLVAILALSSVATAADPGVRWRNITREKLPKDVEAIALEYTVVLVKDGQERAVDPNTHQFSVGDRILVRIQPKDDMYIYVFTQGPMGDRDCLLPTTDEKAPLVKKGKVIELPEDGFFRFNDPPGEEKLIVVATAEPSKDLAALSNVVFRKPLDTLTEQEKKERKNLIAQVDKSMNSFKLKLESAGRISIDSEQDVNDFSKNLKAVKRGIIQDPPHGDVESTYAMAATQRGVGKPELFMEIALKSIASPPAGK